MAERKKHMFVVDFWDDVLKNFQTLESYKNSIIIDEKYFFNQLILNGICFLVYKTEEDIKFGPSRFIGYVNNNLNSHKSSKIHGTETNEAISCILGYDPIHSADLDELYSEYCKNNNIIPYGTGSFGKARKYWYKTDSTDPLFYRFEEEGIRSSKVKKTEVDFDPKYENWKFSVNDITNKIISGEVRVPLLNNQLVEVKGEMVNELKGEFEWYGDNHSYFISINKYKQMTKQQRIVVLRNLRLKLKEIISQNAELYG